MASLEEVGREWLGIAQAAVDDHGAQQDTLELSALLALIERAYKPRIVLEIGGGVGGSAWAWAQLPSVQHVITITSPDPNRQWLCDCFPYQHTVILGDSTSGDTIHQAMRATRSYSPGFLWVDGGHDLPTATKDLYSYRPLCGPGALVGLHDIIPIPRYVDFDVHKLWAQVKAREQTLELVASPDHGPGTGLLLGQLHDPALIPAHERITA